MRRGARCKGCGGKAGGRVFQNVSRGVFRVTTRTRQQQPNSTTLQRRLFSSSSFFFRPPPLFPGRSRSSVRQRLPTQGYPAADKLIGGRNFGITGWGRGCGAGAVFGKQPVLVGDVVSGVCVPAGVGSGLIRGKRRGSKKQKGDRIRGGRSGETAAETQRREDETWGEK